MNKYTKIILIVALPLIIAGCAMPKPITNQVSNNPQQDKIVGLAKALAAAEAKEYGSKYCSACIMQKNMFGEVAWKNINFIECSIDASETQNAACKAAGITLYPTWEFKDGSRLEGVQQFATLAQKIGFEF